MNTVFEASTARAMEALGKRLGRALTGSGIVFLHGELGAGKTTLSRGILRAYGHAGAVKSPTYTLVEPYELPEATLFHFDLYRLQDSMELELMGFRDYFRDDALTLVEWPERGSGMLPRADLDVHILAINGGRKVTLTVLSDRGRSVLERMQS